MRRTSKSASHLLWYTNYMTTLTINLPVEQFEKLEQLAGRYQIAPEELVRYSVAELLLRPQEDFDQALAYVLKKNAELYRQLA